MDKITRVLHSFHAIESSTQMQDGIDELKSAHAPGASSLEELVGIRVILPRSRFSHRTLEQRM